MRGFLITLLLFLGVAVLFLHSIGNLEPTGRMASLVSRLPIWTPWRMESSEPARQRFGGPVMIRNYSR